MRDCLKLPVLREQMLAVEASSLFCKVVIESTTERVTNYAQFPFTHPYIWGVRIDLTK